MEKYISCPFELWSSWFTFVPQSEALTHWGRVTHICVSELTIIGSDNGLSPGRRQATIWTNAGILLIRYLGTNFSETIIKIYIFLFKKMHLKLLSEIWRPFCLGLNVLTHWGLVRLLRHTYALVTWVVFGSGNGLVHVQHWAITWANVGLELVWPHKQNAVNMKQSTNFSFKKMHVKMLKQNISHTVLIVTPYGDIELGQHWFR